MKTSLSWLKAYIPDLNVTAKEYADGMTLSGTKVETYEALDEHLEKIVVGRIESIEKHPDADKLVVCQVDVGSETVQIVTGASNVFEGALVPVVLAGGRVAAGHGKDASPDGLKIKKGKLRGVESFGMMCSIEELGSTKDMYPEAPEDGIYIFGDGVNPGDDAVEALGLHDVVTEYEITSNRVDCYSVIGIAREAAATFGKTFHAPAIIETGNDEDVNDYIKVTVKDAELCPRYCARVVKNVKIAPSPEWMQRRLASVGIRPINNLVDITNYVMEEYGQPMHAYDWDKVSGHEIIVSRAQDGEKFVTLDGKERDLDSDILMIRDGEKAVGLAGIMGGENTMITDDVTTVLFEAANFDGTNIRLSSKRLGMRTDASGKFEKGLDPNTAIDAINRACELVEALGAGEVVGGTVDVYPVVKEGNRVPFEPDKYNALLGTNVSAQTMLGYFKAIDLDYDEATNEIVVPSWRQDVKCMNDLAEEVARFYGYDNIPRTYPKSGQGQGKLSDKLFIEQIARNVALSAGFSQAFSYSFESPKVFDRFLLDKDDALRNAVEISNPLGEDFSIMRTLPLNGLMGSLGGNYGHRNKSAALFEIANIYLPKALPLTELPDERTQFTLAMYGYEDFFFMKAVCEEFLGKVGMSGRVTYDPSCDRPYLHPGRKADIVYDGEVIGFIGEMHPQVSDSYGIGDRVVVANLDMPYIVEKASFDRKFTAFARFPAVNRDISLVVPVEVTNGDIEDCIIKNAGALLEKAELFDIYEGDQIEKGFKSLAYTLSFRAKDHTLEDGDVSPLMEKVVGALGKLNITLRS
ncbi:MAG: phenylalanine--tRNA ligase subunit beta [Eubacterium sp.]|nr:phenylalanine--tRNA ligase subunit beta [Eubacterium sp.]